MAGANNNYDKIILALFEKKYNSGDEAVCFNREELSMMAAKLKIEVPKNLGDIVYSYKYRKPLPDKITSTAPKGSYWRIHNVGFGEYEFKLTKGTEFVEPDPMLATIKIPDATPSIVRKHSLSDEQALLAIVRYNRLIDIFLGISCYSLQNHLRTTVRGIGQIETDEIYVGVDKTGAQYIIPVQAKGGSDRIGITQIEQDMALCEQKYPELVCRSIACQFVTADIVAIFEFIIDEENIAKVNEKHYKIVNARDITVEELNSYSLHS